MKEQDEIALVSDLVENTKETVIVNASLKIMRPYVC